MAKNTKKKNKDKFQISKLNPDIQPLLDKTKCFLKRYRNYRTKYVQQKSQHYVSDVKLIACL